MWIQIGNWIYLPPTILRYSSNLWRYCHTPQFTCHWDTPSAASQTVSPLSSGVWNSFLVQLELARLAP
jgi:hypothetical protein